MLPGVGGFEYIFIVILLIIFVGPKDLPSLIRGMGRTFGKIKKLAQEFKTMINDLAKESGVDDIKKTINKTKPINLTEEITNSINTTIKNNVDSDDSNKGSK
jgi:sec-independent protein translocase protein TatB